MIARWIFATLHLLALGIGLAAVRARAKALRGPLDEGGLRRVFYADAWWGIAALVWISTGLVRLLVGMEKPTVYYMHNGAFMAKMGFLALILILEIAPMVGLIGWRRAIARHEAPDTRKARLYAILSDNQSLLVILMVFAATAMARGLGQL